ncbi:NAD(P)H-quinone oxidoreductase subunit K, chloroplastic, partial [Cucurbita argyrosperma subsp. argyrosperma]
MNQSTWMEPSLLQEQGDGFDFDPYGLVPRSSPSRADFIFPAGASDRFYEQMPEPIYVLPMGA